VEEENRKYGVGIYIIGEETREVAHVNFFEDPVGKYRHTILTVLT